MLIQSVVEDEILSIWASLEMPEVVTPADIKRCRMVTLVQFPRLAELEIKAGKEWQTKKIELSGVTANNSQFEKAKHTTTEYYIYSMIQRHAEWLASHGIGLQSQAKNLGRELNDAGQVGTGSNGWPV